MKRAVLVFLALVLALCSWALPLQAATHQVRILYVNDFHGFAEPQKLSGSSDMQGGIADLAALAESLRQEKPGLLLAAGDMIQGHTWANLFSGKPAVEVMNIMRFDAMVVGNHEFDFGLKTLVERAHEADFPILGANVAGVAELKPYMIKEVQGLKIGIIGVVTEETPQATHPSNVAGLTFLPVAETVGQYVKALRDRVDVIVVLSHVGLNGDVMLAKQVPGIDVIVGGHSHTKVDRPMAVGGTMIVQAWQHGLVLGVLDLTVRDGKIIEHAGRLESIRPGSVKKQDAVAAVVDRYAAEVKALMGRVIGEAAVELDGANVRTRETNLGNYFADLIRKEAGADAAVINGGGLRTGIRKGEITVNDVYTVAPFNNYIVSIKLTGKQLRDALEHGVSAVEHRDGRFPQVSGLYFTYAPGKKAGSRIIAVMVSGQPLDLEKTYTVATNDFLAAGGDGYRAFQEAIRQSADFSITGGTLKSSNLVYNDAGRWLRDVAVGYIQQQKKIAPVTEGRIKEVACHEGVCQ